MKTQTTHPETVATRPRLTTNPRSITSSTDNSRNEKKAAMNSLLKEEEIASLAYKIWQEQGCPDGFKEMHRRLAEQELQSESSESHAT